MPPPPVSRSGARPWIVTLEEQRAKVGGDEKPAAAKARVAGDVVQHGQHPAVGDAVALHQELGAAWVPEAVAQEHGQALGLAKGELEAIAALSAELEPRAQAHFANALKRLYQSLGQLLSRLPAEARGPSAKQALQALQELAARAGTGDHLVAALSATASLLDSSLRLDARRRLVLTPELAADRMARAAEAVGRLHASLLGRAGVGTALNVYPRLVEGLEFAAPALEAGRQAALWQAAADLLATHTPEDGLTQAQAGEVARVLYLAIAERGPDHDAVLAAAKEGLSAAVPQQEVALALLRSPAGAVLEPRAQGPLPAHAEAVLAAVQEALAAQLAARAAPSAQLVSGVEQLHAALAGHVLKPGALLEPPAAQDLVGAIATLGAHPQAARLFSLLAVAVQKDDFKLAQVGNPPALLRTLLWTSCPPRPAGDAVLLPPLTKAPIEQALSAVLALAPHVGTLPKKPALDKASGRLVAEVVARAAAAGALERPQESVDEYAARWVAAGLALSDFGQLAPKLEELASALAFELEGSLEGQRLADLTALVYLVNLRQPRVGIPGLLRGEGKRPGLIDLADPSKRYFQRPRDVLDTLLQHVPQQKDAVAEPLTRLALELASAASLVADSRLYTPRISQDFRQAIASHLTLKAGPGAAGPLAVQLQQRSAASVAHIVASMPELPPEMAICVAHFATPEQIAWMCERAEKSRSLKSARLLRDAVYTCAHIAKPELLEALRTTPAPSKVVSRTIEALAKAWRDRTTGQVPAQHYLDKLKAGEDPTVVAAAAAGAVTAVDVLALTGGRTTAEGLAALGAPSRTRTDLHKSTADVINYNLTQHYHAAGTTMDAAAKPHLGTKVRNAFLDHVVKPAAMGQWPAHRYESEIGKKIMARLSPGQQELWRATSYTALAGEAGRAGDPASQAALADAAVTVRGIAKALPAWIELSPVEGVPPLRWDGASLAALRARRDELMAELRGAEKGSQAHRRGSAAIGALRQNLALLELHQGLAAQQDADPATLLRRALPLLAAAAALLRSFGAGFRDALDEIAAAKVYLSQAGPPDGTYAADEDSLEALLTANHSGCLSKAYGNNGRQWGLCQAAVDANTRMLRVYTDGKQAVRGFLRMYEAELGAYKGPVLFADEPVADGGGGEAEKALWFRHALLKASAMGVPLTSLSAPAWDAVIKAAGLAEQVVYEKAAGTVTADEGHTGMTHSDKMFGGKPQHGPCKGQFHVIKPKPARGAAG